MPQVRDRRATHDASHAGVVETGEATQERALAATVRAADLDQVAGRNGEVEGAEQFLPRHDAGEAVGVEEGLAHLLAGTNADGDVRAPTDGTSAHRQDSAQAPP